MTDHLAAIKQLKYRYLRALDTKDWETFAATLTDDVTGAYGELHFTGRTELVAFMRESLGPAVITEHRVDHPEISFDDPDLDDPEHASGRWYLQDRVIVPDFSHMIIGAAFYADRYRRTADGWRIAATGYRRTYEASLNLADLPSFQLKVGPAVHR